MRKKLTRRTKTAIKRHSNVPPDWYERSIKENILQRFWHKKRFKEVAKLVEKTGGKILDIGSADGTFSRIILDRSKGEYVIGIDVLKASVDWANARHKDTGKMEFRLGDAHKLEFKANSFDSVFALEVLEHVDDPEAVLKGVKRVLKKGGYAVFLVPADNLLFEVIWFFWTKWRGRIWHDTHIQSFKKGWLPKLCKRVGFKVEEDKKFLLGMLHVVKVRKKK